MVSFSQMKSCLILFDASDEQICQVMFGIIKDLQDMGKGIRAVGYVPWKNNPHYCFPKLSFDYLNAKGIAMSGIPKAEFVQDLLRMRFDLLIDFMTFWEPGMFYIAALANADLKISGTSYSYNYPKVDVFDLTIENVGMTQIEFYYAIRKYLQQLNNGQD